jgi:hypothetical protein
LTTVLDKQKWIGDAVVFAVVLLSRVPFVSPGLGVDPDAWRIVAASRFFVGTGMYTASRVPGYPVVELGMATVGRADFPVYNLLTAVVTSVGAVALLVLLYDGRILPAAHRCRRLHLRARGVHRNLHGLPVGRIVHDRRVVLRSDRSAVARRVVPGCRSRTARRGSDPTRDRGVLGPRRRAVRSAGPPFAGACGVLVRAGDGGVHRHVPGDMTSRVGAGLQRSQDPLPGAVALPAAEQPVQRGPEPVAGGDVPPGRAGAYAPADPVDQPAAASRWPPAASRWRQQRRKNGPLRVGQIAAVGRG